MVHTSNVTDTKTGSVTSVHYVGKTSYVWGSEITIDGVPLASQRNLVVNMDMETRRPAGLNEEWKRKTTDFLSSIDRPNQSITVPNFPSHAEELHELSVTVDINHTDINMHANYKFYIFGSMACLRDAIDSKKIPHYVDFKFEDVVVRELISVFEKECVLDDNVIFRLVQAPDGSLSVGVYLGHERMSYSRTELAMLNSNPARL